MPLAQVLHGRTLNAVEKHESSWGFSFSDGVAINASCPWRVIIDGSVRIAGDDHEQRFGLPEPVDAAAVCTELLQGKVTGLLPGSATADLTVQFEGGAILQLVADSAGYEAWVLDGPGICIVGRGGE